LAHFNAGEFAVCLNRLNHYVERVASPHRPFPPAIALRSRVYLLLDHVRARMYLSSAELIFNCV
jgi:hypothetical protein